jgi:hypothetical protein
MGKIIPYAVFMKKIVALCAALVVLVSCSMDNDVQDFDIAFVPVISVDAPEVVVPGQTSYFNLYYRRPNDCYFVNSFDYHAEGNIRTVALQAIVVEDNNCMSLETAEAESIQMPFECPPNYVNEIYIFRFYSGPGTASAGNTLEYTEIEVPVAQQ